MELRPLHATRCTDGWSQLDGRRRVPNLTQRGASGRTKVSTEELRLVAQSPEVFSQLSALMCCPASGQHVLVRHSCQTVLLEQIIDRLAQEMLHCHVLVH